MNPTFYEFFAGGGMARLGLGPRWECLFSNDFDLKKAASYRSNHLPANELFVGDIATVAPDQLPGCADLAWASFPCQDLSLAGSGAGLKGARSGTFWSFWRLMQALAAEGRPPKTIVLENVCGAVTSHGGRDFAAICGALHEAGYSFGAIAVDAVHWVPQSRPRLFILGVHRGLLLPSQVHQSSGSFEWHPEAIQRAYRSLPQAVRESWKWWQMPLPKPRTTKLADIVEGTPTGTNWHSREETERLLLLMNPLHASKVERAIQQSLETGKIIVGGVYKRTRDGRQRAEVRFDDVAGCLRTPVGGSSRQSIIVVSEGTIRSRLLSTREAARLMGLPDNYILPAHYNAAYHLVGDGVVVPVVRHLAQHILEPVLTANKALAAAAG